MHCMKCGSEISDGQVFCDSCLAQMNRYPVAPETKILLPSRPAPDAVKKQPQRRRVLSPEDKLRRLRVLVKWLSICLVGAILLLAFSIALLLEPSGPAEPQDNIGQNYNTVGEDTPSS